MEQAIAERLPEVILESVADFLLPIVNDGVDNRHSGVGITA